MPPHPMDTNQPDYERAEEGKDYVEKQDDWYVYGSAKNY